MPEGILSRVDQLSLPAKKGILSGDNIASALLTGQAPSADLVPQKGSQVAPVGTFLSDSPGVTRKKVRRLAREDGTEEVPLIRYLDNRVVPHYQISEGSGQADTPGLAVSQVSSREAIDLAFQDWSDLAIEPTSATDQQRDLRSSPFGEGDDHGWLKASLIAACLATSIHMLFQGQDSLSPAQKSPREPEDREQ